MKKFIVVGLIQMLVVLFSGCGWDTSCDCNDPLEEFYQEYYAECVSLCNNLDTWIDLCREDISNPDCVENYWVKGESNKGCAETNEVVQEYMYDEDCGFFKFLHIIAELESLFY